MLEGKERELRAALNGERCFLRRSRGDDALWVSDLPRHISDVGRLGDVERCLAPLGVVCRMDESSRLWRLDLTLDGIRVLADALPLKPPRLPSDDALHPAYALCRLLCMHTAPLDAQPLEPFRAVLKRMDGAPQAMLQIIQPIHMLCAQLLRGKLPLPSAAGRALAQWLTDREETQ